MSVGENLPNGFTIDLERRLRGKDAAVTVHVSVYGKAETEAVDIHLVKNPAFVLFCFDRNHTLWLDVRWNIVWVLRHKPPFCLHTPGPLDYTATSGFIPKVVFDCESRVVFS